MKINIRLLKKEADFLLERRKKGEKKEKTHTAMRYGVGFEKGILMMFIYYHISTFLSRGWKKIFEKN